MTVRVVDCRAAAPMPPPPPQAQRRGHPAARPAALAGAPLLLLAGVGGYLQGWLIGLVAVAGAVLLLGAATGRVRWGWLALILAGALLVAPSEQGALLLVAFVACLWLWWSAHRGARAAVGPGAARADPEREAAQLAGLYGELRVGAVLARELPDGFVLLNGVKLPRGAGDIDHLVVGPTGAFLLETKTMAGLIVCERDGTWRRTRMGRNGTSYPAFIGDPAAQVERSIRSARACLRARVSRLFRGNALWIQGLIVFPHPQTVLAAEHSRVPALPLEQVVRTICAYPARRRLDPGEVEEVVEALVAEVTGRAPVAAQRAQAITEVALALPVLLALVFGIIGMSRLVQAEMAVVAVAHEAARAGALAHSPGEAVRLGDDRGRQVARGYGLDPEALEIEIDPATFRRQDGAVRAAATYAVSLGDLPLLAWLPPRRVRAAHTEWVDPYRSEVNG